MSIHTGITGMCEQLNRVLGPQSGSLKEQKAILTTLPSLSIPLSFVSFSSPATPPPPKAAPLTSILGATEALEFIQEQLLKKPAFNIFELA